MKAPSAHSQNLDSWSVLMRKLISLPTAITRVTLDRRSYYKRASGYLAVVAVCAILGVMYFTTRTAQAVTCTWTGATNTDWATTGNWSGCQGGGTAPPASGDTVIIPSTANQPVITSAVTIAALTINTGATFTISSNTLTVNGNIGLNADGGATTTLSNSGTLSQTSGTTTLSRNTAGTANINLSGTGTWNLNNLTTSSTTTNYNLANLATYTIAGDITRTGGTLVPGTSTVILTGSGKLLNGSGSHSYYNLTISGGASITNPSGSVGNVTIAKDLTVTGTFSQDAARSTTFSFAGTSTLSGGGAMTLGSVSVQGGTTLSAGSQNFSVVGATFSVSSGGTFNGSSGTVSFTGSIAQAINGTGTRTFNNLTINNSSGVTLSNASTVNGTLTLSNGTFTNTATLTLGNGATISRDTGTLSAAPTFGTSVNLVYTGTTGVTTGNEVPTSTTVLNNLADSKSGGVTLGANTTVNGTLSVTSGTFDQGGSFNLSAGTIAISSAGTLKNFGTGDLSVGAGGVSNAGRINYDGSGAGCGGLDAILIRSSDNATQRSWSGTGSFSMTDVDVSRQGGTAIILVRSGTDSLNNGVNWVFIASCAGGGNTYTWNGTTSTDYQTPANWTPARAPNASDTLIFDGSTTPGPTVTNVPTETIASLQVTNGAFVDMSTSASNTLTISGAATADFSVGSGNSLTLSGTNALKILVTSNSTGLVTGFMALTGNAAHQLLASGGASIVTFSGSNSIFTTATGYSSGTNPFGTGAGGNGANNSIVFASGSTYVHNNGGTPFGSPGPVVVFQTGSLANWLTSTGFEASGRTYANLQIGLPSTQTTVSHSGAGNFQFDNLTIASSGSNNSSLTFTGSGGSTVTIQGNITSTGAGDGAVVSDVFLTGGTGGIVLNTFAAHTFSKTGNNRTVTFGSNANVDSGAALTLSRNLIVTPLASTLSIRGTLTAGSGGYVIGNLLRPASGTTVFEVGTANGYSPVTLSSILGGPGDFTVRANQASLPSLDPNKAIHRYWTLANGSPGITSAILKFEYLLADVFGTPANYRIVKYVNSAASVTFPDAPTDDVDEANFTATTTNQISSFSSWSVAEPAAVTLAKMESFSSTSFNNGNLVKWQTGYEVDNVGFNVYRVSGGKLVRVTPSLVAGSALMAGRTALTAGLSYTWWDPKGLADSEYYVEDMDLNGTRTMHGPIATAFGGNIESPSKEQAMLLSQIGNLQADATRFVTGYPAAGQQTGVQPTNAVSPNSATPEPELQIQPEREPGAPQPVIKKGLYNKLQLLEKDDIPDPVPSQRTRETDTSTTATIAPPTRGDRLSIGNDDPIRKQRTIAAGSAVKIAVRQPGWYRVTQAELSAAGLNPNTDQSRLQLYSDGIEQPILVRGSNGVQLGPDGSVEFYGIGMDTLTSDTRTYWLIVGDQPGKRINGQKGATSAASAEAFATIGGQDSSLKSTAAASSAFSYTVERKDRVFYFSALINGEVDNFFGPVLSKTATRQDLVLRNIDQASDQATLELSLQGITAQTHKVRVVVNRFDMGLVEFANQNQLNRAFTIPRSTLVEGNNAITLTSTNGDADLSLVDYVRLTYMKSYRAESDALTFTSSSATPLTVEGFTTSDIRVFDITNGASIKQVNAKVLANGSTYSVKVPGGLGSNRVLMALADSQLRHPAAITANEASSLSSSNNRADFVIVTHRNFRDAVQPLADLRRSQGLETAVVDVEDVYDEFSYGAKSRTAIRDFLALAKNSWTLAPRYVLFFGDASYDPRNYQGYAQDFVPTKLLDATLMETASDDALADIDNDGLADMAVGRLPVQTAQQAQLIVGKIINYAPGQTANSALLVSDHLEGFDFEAASNELRNLLPAGLTVTMVNRGNNPTAQVKSEIIGGINAGPMLINYAGHGSADSWTGAGILNNNDIATLSNSNRLPLFVSMTCLNGRFQDSNRLSLAEALLKSEHGGAIAVWASSGLTEPNAQAAIDQQLMRLLFADGQSPLLGDAVRGAKAATADPDVRRTWILFGDPTMRMR